jgi:hypothetical protein
MVRDNVVFRFSIDSAKAQQTIRTLEASVRKLGGTMIKTGADAQRMSTQLNTSGTNAAASAVNFQTATQGALNLSTAMVQTFTSISNLDRANNRAKMSIIAVARAEDLLNNKKQRLKEMTEAGTTAGGKYANMQREIATATFDLTVKQEKQVIEQGAVNDIYMLFATNIANVTISSLQTITILYGHERSAKLASNAARKIGNFLHWEEVRASLATQRATAIETAMKLNNANATNVQATAMQRLALATRTFMSSNPILLALMIGSTAAFAIHESNILKTKDAYNELTGAEKDFESQVKEGRDGLE